jgi:hypothetical protein
MDLGEGRQLRKELYDFTKMAVRFLCGVKETWRFSRSMNCSSAESQIKLYIKIFGVQEKKLRGTWSIGGG